MNGLGKTILSLGFAVGLLLLYVHEQVALFDVSYAMQARSEKLTRLSEEYRRLRFEVDQLKAPRLLDEKMKQLSLGLTLPQEIRVVRVALPEMERPLTRAAIQPMSARISDFLGKWVDIAQAKTDE